MDWQTLVALFAVAMAGITLLDRLLGRGLSIREHEAYKTGVEQQHKDSVAQTQREIDMIREEIKLLQAKVPTTGELDKVTHAMEQRLDRLEDQLRSYRQ